MVKRTQTILTRIEEQEKNLVGPQRIFRTVKGSNRIFVKRGNENWLVPSWISVKGNLCWRLDETLYVKMKNGFVLMLQGDKWVPGDAETKAQINDPAEVEKKDLEI